MGRKNGLNVVVAGMASLPAQARRVALYRKAVRLAFASSQKSARIRGEINVVFLGRAAMLRMNRHYLGHDYDTDVIAFAHDAPQAPVSGDYPIGDIFVSTWMTRKQAGELGHTIAVESATLVVHGALHLVGHDDLRPAAKARMFKVQARIVSALHA
jgi:probable rRNA maturation factor